VSVVGVEVGVVVVSHGGGVVDLDRKTSVVRFSSCIVVLLVLVEVMLLLLLLMSSLPFLLAHSHAHSLFALIFFSFASSIVLHALMKEMAALFTSTHALIHSLAGHSLPSLSYAVLHALIKEMAALFTSTHALLHSLAALSSPSVHSYAVLHALMKEMAALFTDEVFNIGCDETSLKGQCTVQSTFDIERKVQHTLHC
jgi:hypothetical protein